MKKNVFSPIIILFLAAFAFACGSAENKSESGNDIDTEEDMTLDEAQAEVEDALDMISESGGGLTNADIDRYIETIIPMTEELEALGENWGDDMDEYSLRQTLESNEVMEVVEKYGWDKDFGAKFMAITFGTAVVGMEAELEKLPEDQRAQVNAMMGAQMDAYRKAVQQADLDLLKKRYDDLFKVMNEMSDE